jgi:hypothetical protein
MAGIKTHMSTCSHEQIKTVDLFPRTDNIHENHGRPIPLYGKLVKYIPDINLITPCHVETVVLMSRVDIGQMKK